MCICLYIIYGRLVRTVGRLGHSLELSSPKVKNQRISLFSIVVVCLFNLFFHFSCSIIPDD